MTSSTKRFGNCFSKAKTWATTSSVARNLIASLAYPLLLTQGAVAQQLPSPDGGSIVIEAENYSNASNGSPLTHACDACSGGSNLGDYSFDNWFEFELETTELLSYDVSLHAASPTGTIVEVILVTETREISLGSIAVLATESFTDYRDTASLNISLAPGTHTLRFKNTQISVNVDFVKFTAGSISSISTELPIANAGPDINPLKGWTSGWWRENEDHASVGFQYIEWGRFEPVNDEYDFDYVEEVLNRHGSAGRHFIIQFVCDWDGNEELEDNYLGPDWLLDIVGQRVGHADPVDPTSRLVRATNYDHPVFIAEAIEAVHALQNKYRDDERTFVIQVGVLGLWAEWHTFPREDFDPSTETKQAILDAYFDNIGDMQTQVRYPDEPVNTPRRQMGYTNGSVVPTEHGYEFGDGIEPQMLWGNGPVGGEWPPNVEQVYWLNFFDSEEGYDFINQAAYSTILPPEVRDISAMVPGFDAQGQFMDMHRHLGYNFQVHEVRYLESANGTGPVHVEVDLQNIGIAPFYMDWDLQFAILNEANETVEIMKTEVDLRSIGPGQSMTVTASSGVSLDASLQYRIGLRVLQPGAANAKPDDMKWKLNARNTYVVLANDLEVVDGVWGTGNALQGGWNVLTDIGMTLGDLNEDGVVNFLDISPFIAALSTGVYVPAADFNDDKVVDFLDIPRFIEVLIAS